MLGFLCGINLIASGTNSPICLYFALTENLPMDPESLTYIFYLERSTTPPHSPTPVALTFR